MEIVFDQEDELTKFTEALQQVSQLAAPLAEQAVGQTLTALKSEMSPYPPQPDRDRANPGDKPSPYNTYVRGIGKFPRSAFQHSENGFVRKGKGAFKAGPRGGKVSRTSQQLNKRWSIRVSGSQTEIEGELTNTASYAGLVMGHKSGMASSDDIPEQAPFHAQTGWANVDDSIEAVIPKRDAFFSSAIDQLISKLAGK